MNSSWSKINDISRFLPVQQSRATGVIEQADRRRQVVEDMDEQIVNQTSDLHRINETSLIAQNNLTFIMEQLEKVRSELVQLTGRLSDVESVSEEDLKMVNETVSRLSEAVNENQHLIDAAQEKANQLTRSTDELENKNKQL